MTPTPGGRLPSARREGVQLSRVDALNRTVRLAARQALMEQRTFWRSAEYALFTFALPLALLLLIGSTTATGDLPGTHVERPDDLRARRSSRSGSSWPPT